MGADGRNHHRHGPTRGALLGVLTVSDTRTEETDTSGALIQQLLADNGHRAHDYRVVPDDPEAVERQVRTWLDDPRCDGVTLSGGTGIAARDRTREAIEGLIEQRLDGFGELFRMLSFAEVGSRAMLSRALGGVARGKPVFSLPGSTAAVRLAMTRLILPELVHLLDQLGRLS